MTYLEDKVTAITILVVAILLKQHIANHILFLCSINWISKIEVEGIIYSYQNNTSLTMLLFLCSINWISKYRSWGNYFLVQSTKGNCFVSRFCITSKITWNKNLVITLDNEISSELLYSWNYERLWDITH